MFCTVIIRITAQQLFKIRVHQYRRGHTQPVCLAFRFAEDIHLPADTGGQRHNMGFPQRIDRRVGHLGKLLAEIVINQARAGREYRKRGIIPHRADRFLAVFPQHPQHLFQLFQGVPELLLVDRQLCIIEGALRRRFIHQILIRREPHNIFLQPRLVRMTGFEIVIGLAGMQNAAFLCINHQQFTRPDTAFFRDFIRLIIPDTDLRGTGDQFICGNDIAGRAQPVAVKVTGRIASVRDNNPGRAVPRLHMHGVKIKKGAQIIIHIRMILPGRRHQQPHGAYQIHPAVEKQFEHIIQ